MFFDKIVRPALYRLSYHDPELVHERTIGVLAEPGQDAD
ncbi:dihydroorotate dehydrogenase (quinone), partial [Amycolatopsis mediterranei]